ncbi:MAG: hypothetical protein JWP59_213 [Massilia sp.]|jgi:type VI secretion system protein ImpM|nr:hypothetical protein [Massilia sp.]
MGVDVSGNVCGSRPGFFGKVRSHGDFVGAALPPAFRQRWDQWLQAGLLHSRAELGADWLAAWLNGAIWRFALGAGVADELPWCGVMMPGLDKVGRYFPLTIASPCAIGAALPDAGWFEQLETLALQSLEPDFDLAAFDAALAALPAADRTGELAPAPGPPAGRSRWWTEGGALVAPCQASCAGLPTAAQFTALLDGRWVERGWPP